MSQLWHWLREARAWWGHSDTCGEPAHGQNAPLLVTPQSEALEAHR